ncbi:MAG: hypothetical protein IJL76_03830 [Bacilli bacterium]|nr:hypothetical protein [Bacilli bacterium]
MKVDKEFICKMLEVKYIRSKGYNPKDFDDFYNKIYPDEWLDNNDYDTMIKMLSEAINEDKLIVETDKYKEITKGKII